MVLLTFVATCHALPTRAFPPPSGRTVARKPCRRIQSLVQLGTGTMVNAQCHYCAARSKQNAQPCGWADLSDKQIASVPVIAALLIAGDDAVLDMNHTMRILGNIVLVRDQNDRVALGLEPVE